MQKVNDVFKQRMAQYTEASCLHVVASGNPVYAHLPMPILRMAIGKVYQAVAEDLLQGAVPRAVTAQFSRIGAQRLRDGALISQILAGAGYGFEVVSQDLRQHFHDDLAAYAWWEWARAQLSYAGAGTLADAYLAAREAEVRAQAEEIFRLSAPLLPLYPGILVLPLVGRLDAVRAGQVTMTMLSAIVAHASRVVLIDVTGLPTLDVAVAQRLLTAGKAVRLVGAVPVVVGLSPAVAKAVVKSGVELAGIQLLGNLGDGLKYALGRLGKAIVDTGEKRRQAGEGSIPSSRPKP